MIMRICAATGPEDRLATAIFVAALVHGLRHPRRALQRAAGARSRRCRRSRSCWCPTGRTTTRRTRTRPTSPSAISTAPAPTRDVGRTSLPEAVRPAWSRPDAVAASGDSPLEEAATGGRRIGSLAQPRLAGRRGARLGRRADASRRRSRPIPLDARPLRADRRRTPRRRTTNLQLRGELVGGRPPARRHARIADRRLPRRLEAAHRARRHAQFPERGPTARAVGQSGARGRDPRRRPRSSRCSCAAPAATANSTMRPSASCAWPRRSTRSRRRMRERYPVLRFAYEWQFLNGQLGDGAVYSTTLTWSRLCGRLRSILRRWPPRT